MNRLTRRDTLLVGAGALAGATLLHAGRALADVPAADVPAPKFDVEKGAALKVLRPSKFVEGDERLFAENTKKFIAQYGVQVDIDNEGWEDLRPKTAVAANVGSGPDIVLAWSDDPHKFASKCLDLTDLAEYLGEKYGGWYELAERMGKAKDGHWIAMPYGGSGGRICYRKSWVNEAGFDGIPKDTGRLPQALPGAEEERPSRRAWRSATRWATPTPGATGSCGPSAARWSTRTTTSPSTARRRSRR